MQDQSTRVASHELRAGEEFAGHRIESVLGRGGMGVVYRAVDLRLNRLAALKVITPALSADEDFRRRFQRESELAIRSEERRVGKECRPSGTAYSCNCRRGVIIVARVTSAPRTVSNQWR